MGARYMTRNGTAQAPSTGLPGLDRLLTGLIHGDNVIWRVRSPADYAPFVKPFCAGAQASGHSVTYFRFARHEPLLSPEDGAEVVHLDPAGGFEGFVSEIRRTVDRGGRGACYVFDLLSGLAADWFSDQMLGNFFMLTCPHILKAGGLAYFSLLRECHSREAVDAISDTAQVVIDVFRHGGGTQIHPLKVQNRHSPAMYMIHSLEDGQFVPVTDSASIAGISASEPWPGMEGAAPAGLWERAFMEGEKALASSGGKTTPDLSAAFERLLGMAVTRDGRIAGLAKRYLGMPDVLEIRRRMIGTGLIGGKSVGMLLARAILRAESPETAQVLEQHDSFFVGSDVYYTFIVRNGLWQVREHQKDRDLFLEGAGGARERMMSGVFPDSIFRQFSAMLDHFGQYPIIVRSSSLLEDNFGNSFAGKYESVFLANQGPRSHRLAELLDGVRRVYASTMSEEALAYRASRGLLGRDEQMALLVQRVSGRMHGGIFAPLVAGVGLSFNPYVWNENIDPEAGVMRIVMGLGTRAVDRSDDDYTRVVSLNEPARRPEVSPEEALSFSQRRVDVIDLEANRPDSRWFADLVREHPGLPMELLVPPRSRGGESDPASPPILTFEGLLMDTPFVGEVRRMLEVLERTYEYPVDTEFTAEFLPDGRHHINLLQCRPLQVKGGGAAIAEPPAVPRERVILETRGAVIGRSRCEDIERIVFVIPARYAGMPVARRHALADEVGRIMRAGGGKRTLLLGPGRWGTTTPSLGVPVAFRDIEPASVIGEIVAMGQGLVPDVSLGTHFFNELVETGMLYLALFPHREGNFLNEALLESLPARAPEGGDFPESAGTVRAISVGDIPGNPAVRLNANSLTQRVSCYLEYPAGGRA